MSLRRVGPVPVALAFAAGIALASSDHIHGALVWVLLPLAAGCGFAARRRPPLARAAVPVAVIGCVLALGAWRGAIDPPRPPPGAIADDRGVDELTGEIAGPVLRTTRGVGAWLGEVWVWSAQPLAAGERVAVRGVLRTQRGRLELSAREVVRLADAPGPGARAWRWAAATRDAWSARIAAVDGDPAARAAVRGIATGDRSAVPPSLDARWRIAGIYHVLSVSGLHLAVVAGLVYALLRRLLAASPWGGRIRPARWAAPPALAVAIAYTLITGAQVATLRAGIALALVLLAAALDRPLRLRDALAVAALVLLALAPGDLRDPGFQLSFTAAATLAAVPAGHRGWLRRALTASLWIAITTAPITAYHFAEVAPGGVVGNLVLAPVVELVALPAALVGATTGWQLPIELAVAVVAVVDRGAALAAEVLPLGAVAVDSELALVALVGISLALAARARRTRRDAVAWLALCLAWLAARDPHPPGALRVTFVDAGQGDAAVVELPDGAVWVIDANAPGRAVARVLAAGGHDRVDLAILSHPHPDHYAGFATLGVPIAARWTARDTRSPFAAPVAHPPLGLALAQAGVELWVWGPRFAERDGGPERAAADPVRSVNDNSLVVELRYRGRAILFTGDLEREGEDALVAAGIGAVDVVKVPHHGSPTSSSAALVAATRPALAVISCGRGNAYGFPSPAVVARWQAAGAEVARTDVGGAVRVVIDHAGGLRIARPGS